MGSLEVFRTLVYPFEMEKVGAIHTFLGGNCAQKGVFFVVGVLRSVVFLVCF